MDDIVKWLRSPKPWHKYTPAEIADEIERLRARLAEAERGASIWENTARNLADERDFLRTRLAGAERKQEEERWLSSKTW